MRATTIQLTAMFGPVLAAKVTGFIQCYSLSSYRVCGLLSKFGPKKPEIKRKETVCEIDPFFTMHSKNFTVSLDGHTLQPFFLVCEEILLLLSTKQFTIRLTLNGRRLTSHFKALQSHNAETFQFTIDKSEQAHGNILESTENHLMSVLGRLNGLSTEQGTSSIGQFIEVTKEKAINCIPTQFSTNQRMLELLSLQSLFSR